MPADMAAIRDAGYARRMQDIPEGYHLVAVPVASLETGGEWRLAGGRACRAGAGAGHKACGAPTVAELNRGTASYPSWFAYCADHMYGRWIEEGQVMCWILEANSGA